MSKKTLKRILAWIGIALLVGMYVLTLISSLFHSPFATQLFYASLYATFVVPVILYVGISAVNYLKKDDSD
ncbi:hypothetical protein P261_02148 [Lachnospiraceae bacterium TWA4]|nr:hypothetical protein P261_02148 [Lachnospiraceae bacterium TWA4]